MLPIDLEAEPINVKGLGQRVIENPKEGDGGLQFHGNRGVLRRRWTRQSERGHRPSRPDDGRKKAQKPQKCVEFPSEAIRDRRIITASVKCDSANPLFCAFCAFLRPSESLN